MAQHTLNKLRGTKLTHALATPGRHSDGGGLVLQVQNGKALKDGTIPLRAYWVFQYTRLGKANYVCLGSARDVPVTLARQQADALRAIKAGGKCPAELRREEKAAEQKALASAVTFRVAQDDYFRKNVAMLTSAQEFTSVMERHVLPHIGDTLIREITRDDIIAIFENTGLWASKNAVAKKALGYIRRVFHVAIKAGKHPGPNPGELSLTLGESDLTYIATAPGRRAPLPYEELPGFLARLHVLAATKPERYTRRALMLEFTILTVARVGTVEKATWSEIDLENKVWRAPADHMKLKPGERAKLPAGSCWHYPLSDRAIDILRSLPRGQDHELVFGENQNDVLYLCKLLDARDDQGKVVVIHGFRTTATTYLESIKNADGDRLISTDTTELLLAHSLGNKSKAAKFYRTWGLDSYEVRANALQRLADYATGRTGNVIRLPRRAA